MKKVLVFLCFVLTFFKGLVVFADEVDYTISSYNGDLVIHSDNTATFKQTILYEFDSNYKGQYVTLGRAGKMPEGFEAVDYPTVVTYHNDEWVENKTDFEYLSDGYRLKIYNAGHSGDKVKVEVIWKLKNLLFIHNDVAELKWIPISDWDQTIESVGFQIRTDRQVEDHQLFVHLGYFKPEVTIKSQGGVYEVKTGAVDGKLELRAYWDKTIFDMPSTSTQEAKPAILKQEKAIVRNGRYLGIIYKIVLLVSNIVLSVIGAIVYVKNRKKFSPPKITSRVYQAPEDLHPLVVAKAIYDADLKEPKNGMVFDHMIQASLLDLMDRGIVELSDDGKTFIIHQEKPKTALDEALVTFLFASEREVDIDNLFWQYEIDRSVYKQAGLSGSELESFVRDYGRSIEEVMKQNMSSVQKEVQNQLTTLGKTPCFRELSLKEMATLNSSVVWLALPMLLSAVAFIIAMMNNWGKEAGLYSGIPFLLIAPIIAYVGKKSSSLTWNGILTETGGQDYQAWESFSNMFRDIESFNRAEIESLVIWNQVLVFATLFGEAKRVQDYLRVNNIHLSNPALDTYVGSQLSHSIGHSIYNYNNYSTVAAEASHFSVSSSGSSGGGFSGGGGGGGGGAF